MVADDICTIRAVLGHFKREIVNSNPARCWTESTAFFLDYICPLKLLRVRLLILQLEEKK